MKATVVVSCYKQEEYIASCLESILSQEVTFDYSILVADDCSPDRTPEIVTSLAKQHPDKFELLLRKENIGPAKNYINAHQCASGDVIFHIDGDDIMLPGKLEKQCRLFFDNPDVNLVFHRAQYFSDDGEYQSDTGCPQGNPDDIWFFNSEDLANWGSITVHSAYAYRKEARKTSDPRREFMEWFFAMDALLPKGKAAYINTVLVKYRCNATGTSYLNTVSGRLKAYDLYFEDIEYYWIKYPHLRKQLYANIMVTQLGMLRSHLGLHHGMIKKLLTCCYYFRFSLLFSVFSTRKRASPKLLIR